MGHDGEKEKEIRGKKWELHAINHYFSSLVSVYSEHLWLIHSEILFQFSLCSLQDKNMKNEKMTSS